MVDENKARQNTTEKVAMATILVISLLVARLVMHSKTSIRLSLPIELSRSGLSLSMPSGNGWKCEDKWTQENNVFSAGSIFIAGGAKNQSYAQCRYLLAAQKDTPLERAGRRYIKAETIETGTTMAGDIPVDWANVITEAGFEIIVGVAELPGGRQLEIEVLLTAEEQGRAQKVFDRIVKSIRFNDNGLLQAGIRLISNIRNKGLDIARDEDSSVSFFTIADSHDKIIGFTMDAMELVRADANTTINAADYYYLRGTASDEQVSFLSGGADLQQFTWRVETSSKMGSKGIEMTADAGILTVRRSRAGLSVNRRAGRETGEYELSETAVPDIILGPVLTRVLDSNEQAFLIDIIRSDGIITPAYVEKMPPDKGQTDGYSTRMEWLDGRGYWQQTYYNSSKKAAKITLGQESTYTLISTDANEITRIFPERANLVRDKNQVLDRKFESQ
jgi:hypothetical protein